jgi:hypothetical protein
METLQGVRMVVMLSYGVVVAHHRLYVIGVHALPEKTCIILRQSILKEKECRTKPDDGLSIILEKLSLECLMGF